MAADADYAPSVADIDGDGDVEIIVPDSVGAGVGHAGQAYWTDIYSSNGRDFALANQQFPGEYEGTLQDLEALNDKVPYSPENLFYLGWAREIRGKPRQALMAYRAAEANLRVELASAFPPWSGGSWSRRQATQLTHRRRALERWLAP